MLKFDNNIDLEDWYTNLGDGLWVDIKHKQEAGELVVVVNGSDDIIMAYPEDGELWIAFAERKNDGDLEESRKVFDMLKEYALEKGLTAISCMTTRNRVRAFKRFGLKEHSVLLKAEL